MLAGRLRPRAGRRRSAAMRSPEAVREALEAGMSMYGLSSCKLFWHAALDTKALLAWSQDTAVLAFRGTASLTNACSDLKVSPFTRHCMHVSCLQQPALQLHLLAQGMPMPCMQRHGSVRRC